MPYAHAFGTAAVALDIVVLSLRSSELVAFDGSVFLGAAAMDEHHEVKQSLGGNSYFVIGYSASRSQVRVSHVERHVHQVSFQFTGLDEPPKTYANGYRDGAPQAVGPHGRPTHRNFTRLARDLIVTDPTLFD